MVATLGSALTLVYLGKVLDKYPVSKIAFCIIICLALACVAMSFVDSVVMLLFVLYSLRLFGQGMMTHTSQTAMGKWFDAERGRAISLTSPGHQIGEAILPTAVIFLVAAVGWRNTWLFAAAGLILIALPSIVLLMKVERIPDRDSESKEVLGVQAKPETESNISRSTNGKSSQRHWTRGEVLKDEVFWTLLLGVLAPAFIGTAVFFQQDHILKIKGWTPAVFASSYVMLAIATVIFTLIGGWLVDRFNSTVLLPLFLVPMGLGCFALGGSVGVWAIYAFMALLGCSYGFSSALFGTIWPEAYGTKNLGSIRALASAAMVFASALGPGITGLGIDNQIDFQFQLIVMGLYCLVASGSMIVVVMQLVKRSRAENSEARVNSNE